MNYNDILKRLRYTFEYSDDTMMDIFLKGGESVDRATLSNWMKADDHDEFQLMVAKQLTVFLNGLIVLNRGPNREGPPKTEKYLTNNLIFKKLKIALQLTTEEILEAFILNDTTISMHEINSFLRNPEKRQFQPMKDQYLRQFLYALQNKYRPSLSQE